MDRQKLRIRFRKTGDLRLISHRDLARAWERLLRRAQVSLAMSQGFHPHPRINFPSALAVGIESDVELVEVELTVPVLAEEVRERLVEQSFPGLEITDVRALPAGHSKPRVVRAAYVFPVPEARRAQVAEAMQRVEATTAYPVVRASRDAPLDLRTALLDWSLDSDRLRFAVDMTQAAQIRPREVLLALGLDDQELSGAWLKRVELIVADEMAASPSTVPPIQEFACSNSRLIDATPRPMQATEPLELQRKPI